MKAKHIWSALLVLLVVFAAINIQSELRRGKPGEFGRLNPKALPAETRTEPIHEAPPPVVDDQTAADPMLVAPAAREQLLHASTNAPPPNVQATTIEPIVAAPDPALAYPSERRGKSRFTIVGGPEGVSVIKRP